MRTLGILVGICLMGSLTAFGQYGYGGYGGYGYGGYGRMRSMNQMNTTPRASVPNIAGELANRELKWMKDNLNLNKDQQKSTKKLYLDYAKQEQDAIKDILGTKGERPSPDQIKMIQEMMQMLNEEKESQLKPLLTAEQWTTFVAKREERQKVLGNLGAPAPHRLPADSLPAKQP